MYGKIFDSMYDGTLVEDWRALITFQQMIVLCDSNGVLDMTPSAISRRTGIPIEHIKAGIEVLENPDPYSRTPTNEGRRIERLDEHRPWGWVIVNHAYYRDLASKEEKRQADRVRIAVKRASDKDMSLDVAGCSVMSPNVASVADVAYADADTDTDKRKKNSRFAPPTVEEVRAYCLERKNNVNADKFINHYTANGWVRGKTKIKDWRACVKTWEQRDEANRSGTGTGQNGYDNRSRTQRVAEKLDEIAKDAVMEKGFTERVD